MFRHRTESLAEPLPYTRCRTTNPVVVWLGVVVFGGFNRMRKERLRFATDQRDLVSSHTPLKSTLRVRPTLVFGSGRAEPRTSLLMNRCKKKYKILNYRITGCQQTVSACSEESSETLPIARQHAETKQGFSFLQDRY